jgi:hypothetical protein
MPGIPDYKPGDYLKCGEGPEYSKVLVLPGDMCIIKAGHSIGEIISLDEWYFLIGENKVTIQNTTKSDKCNGCALNHTGCYDESCDDMQDIESIGASIRTQSSNVSYNKYITVRTPLTTDTYYDTQEIIRVSPDEYSTLQRTKSRRGTMKPVLSIDSDISTEANIYDDFSENSYDSISEATGEATSEDLDFTVVPEVSHKSKTPWYYRFFLCGVV